MNILKYISTKIRNIRISRYRKQIMECIEKRIGIDGTVEAIHTNSLVVKVTTHNDTNRCVVTVMQVGTSKTGKKVWMWSKYDYMNDSFTKQPKTGTYPYEWVKSK